MVSLPVFVADWEMQCCGTPFRIGTAVLWYLQFLYEDELTAPSEALFAADSAVTLAATATIDDPDTADGLRGALSATWHVSDGDRGRSPVPGTVRRIRLVRHFTVEEDDGTTFVRGGAHMTDLAVSRDRFATGSSRTREESWAETGLLVDLAVDFADVLAAVAD